MSSLPDTTVVSELRKRERAIDLCQSVLRLRGTVDSSDSMVERS